MTHRRSSKQVQLIRLSSFPDLPITETEDFRGWKVIDPDGNDVGEVVDLLVAPGQNRLCFFEVTATDRKRRTVLVPINIISSITNDCVIVLQDRETLLHAPASSSPRIDLKKLKKTYDYFGTSPFWSTDPAPVSFGRYYVV